MAFHEEPRFPECLSLGAKGGPGFNTTVLGLSSGHEQRNENWERAKARYDVARVLDTKAKLDEFVNFFMSKRGRLHSWRFKDHKDYQFDNVVGAGDGSSEQQIQLFKRYTSGDYYYDRPLTKIVEGSWEVFFNDVSQADDSSVQIDITTGILVVSGAAEGAEIRVVGEFDVPVRFDMDGLDDMEIIDKGGDGYFIVVSGNIPIVEVRV